MTTPEYRQPFKLLDEYSRQNHLCFVAELFLSSNRIEYVVCFRPSNESTNPDRFSCRYLKIGTAKFELISQTGVLPISIIEELCCHLDLCHLLYPRPRQMKALWMVFGS